MSTKKVIIWATGIDNLLSGKGLVGGLTVQMMYWALTFKQADWKVLSPVESRIRNLDTSGKIEFFYFPKAKFLNIVFEFFCTLFFMVKHRPKLIITRGATRQLFALALFSKLIGIKLILMFASDSDLNKGKELIARPWDRWLFRMGLLNVSNFVVQNSKQQELLNIKLPKSKSICIPNIWPSKSEISQNRDSVLWVSNFRELKRPQWFVNLAKQLPDIKFIMVGGALNQKLFEQCRQGASMLNNIEFLGACPLSETNLLFERASLFICTSEIEGFPNTFLQAWSNQIPVITTYDPSNIVEKNELGIVVKSEGELLGAISETKNNLKYLSMQKNIKDYFELNHDPNSQFVKLLSAFDI